MNRIFPALAFIVGVISLLGSSCKNDNTKRNVPVIAVGIMQADTIRVTERDSMGHAVTMYILTPDVVEDSLIITPTTAGGVLEVDKVTIGVGFHWQQQEAQQFEGRLRILNHDNTLVLINDIDLESYLESVISSEMSADAPEALLQAHSIISRSWLLSQLSRNHTARDGQVTDNEITVWYDRDDHELFDVCADDHCQRYQGITRRTSPTVAQAVRATRGQVLMWNDTVCDARFSKCCGGITEVFESCWEPINHPYLAPVYDGPDSLQVSPLATEDQAQRWITSRPDAWCANPSSQLLATVLNSYDRATRDYYRWEEKYRADSLGELISRRIGRNPGYIKSLRVIERGTSGRITRLEIAGERDTFIVGKELEIRRALSPSHLYSSAFVPTIEGEGPDAVITLQGAGWGHGVGLCQIGAAVMATKGFTPAEVLSHYYPGANLKQIY